jgi:Flp pilus assembly pilin Flp
MNHADKSFLKDDDGAVTVDWVVLTAACVGMALAAMVSVFSGTQVFGDSVEAYLTDTTVEELAGIE